MKRLINLTLLVLISLTLPFIANAQEERLTIVSGNNQKGEVGTALANPLTVKYETKPSGGDWGVVANKTIYFQNLRDQSASKSASLSANSASTDANGEASVTLTLGRRSGPYTVAASTQKESGGSTKTVQFSAKAFTIRLKIVSGYGQTDTVGRTLANPFVVQLTDQVGDPWSGQTVTFAIHRKPPGSTGTSLTETTATTGTNGQASTTLTLGDTAGAYNVFAQFTKPDKSTLWVRFDVKAEAKVATKLEKRSVDRQSVTGGTQLSTAFTVRVLDQDDAPMSDVSVAFSVSPSSGTVSRSSMTTGSNGQASTVLTVGTDAGTYTVTASVTKPDNTKLTETFTATVPQIITDLLKHSGDGQSALVGTQLSTPLTVKVVDQGGEAMSGVSVNFSVSPISPSSGTLTSTTVSTDTNGFASTTLTLGNSAGTYTVTASVTKADNTKLTKTFTATAEVQVATKLEKRSVDVKSISGGTQLSTAFTVQVLDQYDAPMSGVSVNFSVSPSSGTVNRSSMSTGTNGQASTVLTVGTAAGTYTVTASVTKPDNTKLTVEFTATMPQIITTLQKRSGDGQSARVGTQLTSAFVVRVLDQDEDAMSGVSVSFSVTPSGTLSATTATTNSNGQASTRLTFGSTTGTYTVTASIAGITETVSFTATAKAAPPPPLPEKIATTLEYVSGRGQSAQVNTQLSSAFVVRVLDQNGAALSGVSVSFSVSPSGTLSASTATTAANGQASTILTFGSTTGTYTVTASIAGITETVSFTATAKAVPPPPPRPTPEKIATTLQKVSGDSQSAQVNTQLSSAFVVRVLDQNGAALSGVSVSFSVNPSSGALSASTATTSTNGQASTTLTVGNSAVTYTVTARVAGITETVAFTATAEAAPPPPPPDNTDTSDDNPPENEEPIILVDTKPHQIVFSEIMFQSLGGLHSLPQWIEIRSTAKHEVNLRGWQLTLERRADNPIRIENKDILKVTVTFKEDFIIPPKYSRLITTFNSKNSRLRTHESEHIYSLFDHHFNELDLNVRNRNRLLDPNGFRLTLTDAEAEVIDVIGNLEKGETQWEFPDCYVNRVRSSMFRRFDEGIPLDGTVKGNWLRASDTKHITPNIYYGNPSDVGTPGYRRGDILPVTLSNVRLQNTDTGVVINWTTESEVNNAGFNIYRGLSKEAAFVKINAKMIHGAGTTGERSDYSWTDTTAKPNTIYYYRIEDVSYAGTHTQSATVRLKGLVTAHGKLTTTWGDLKR